MAEDGDDGAIATTAADEGEELGSMSTVLRKLAGDEETRAPLVPGAVIDGTYKIERAVGEGGMGVVYAARDLKLERDVAIKIGSSVSSAALARAGREALALARLSHPNVVVVYQVGEIGGHLYIAMELVSGGNAREWVARGGRGWREIVALYAAAGDGLAAAHAAGLVHRDFKPDNVLVGEGGRPRVADFGLARGAGDEAGSGTGTGTGTGTGSVTQTGAVVGTPAYMAPEQLAGKELDARADQFAFCASLWEALFGARPFAGKTPAEIADAISSSPPAVPAGERARRVPRHVTAAVARGLRVEPDERWPDMTALLAELRRDPAARRRRAAIAAGAAVLAGVAVLAVTRGGAGAPCRVDPSWLAGAWDPSRRIALAHGLEATGAIDAHDTASRAAARLDDYAARWRDARLDACRATYERRELSETAFDRRVACLDGARGRLRAAVELLSHPPDAALVRRAIDVVNALDDPAACSTQGADPPPFDPGMRVRVATFEAQLDQAEVLRTAGRAVEARPLAVSALARARELGLPVLTARALRQLAEIDDTLGHNADAERGYEEAARAAGEAHDDHLLAAVWADLVFQLAATRARLEDAERILLVAESAVARIGNPPQLVAMVTNARTRIALNRGRTDEGLALAKTEVQLLEQAYGPDSLQVGDAENNVGYALAEASRFEEALPHFERALAIFERGYGHDHPIVADTLGNVAGVLSQLDRTDDAAAKLREVLAVEERLLGPDSPRLTTALNNLATIEHMRHHDADARPYIERAVALRRRNGGGPDLADALGMQASIERALDDRDAAARDYREAIAIEERSGGPDAVDLLSPLIGLGNLASDAGQLDEAEAQYRRAVAIAKAKLGPDHRSVVIAEGALAGVLAQRERYGEARAAYEDLLPREERVFGKDHPNVAIELDNYGMVLFHLRRAAEARPLIAHALAIREAHYGPDDRLVGVTLGNLAQVDRALGRTADANAESARAKKIAAAN